MPPNFKFPNLGELWTTAFTINFRRYRRPARHRRKQRRTSLLVGSNRGDFDQGERRIY